MTEVSLDPQVGGFTLLAPEARDGQSDSVTRIEWCLPKNSALVTEMTVLGFTNPHIVIDVVNTVQASEWPDYAMRDKRVVVDRLILPFKYGATYVQFRRPGKTELVAHVIDVPTDAKQRGEISKILSKSYRSDYNFPAFEELSGMIQLGARFMNPNQILDASYTLALTVPEGFFGKPPSVMTKKIIAFALGKNNLVDECDKKKKLIFSLWFGSLKLGFNALVVAVFSFVALALGMRGMNWSQARLISGDYLEMWPSQFATIWTHKKLEKGRTHYDVRSPFFWILSLPALLVVPTLVFLLENIEWKSGSKAPGVSEASQWSHMGFIETCLATWSWMFVLAIVIMNGSTIFRLLTKKSKAAKAKLPNPAIQVAAVNRMAGELSSMVCGTPGRHGRGSVKLVVAAYKARHCKPLPQE